MPLVSCHRVVVQNDDHDQQNPSSSSCDMANSGCVLIKNCPPVTDHRNFEISLFTNRNGVSNNNDDWPIRFILSSYCHTYGDAGILDGKSSCDLCTITCETYCASIPYIKAHDSMACADVGSAYIRTHRDIAVINTMCAWMKLTSVPAASLGIEHCA